MQEPCANELREIAKEASYHYRLVEFSIGEIYGTWETGFEVLGYTITLKEWHRESLLPVWDDRGRHVKFKYNPNTFLKQCKKYAHNVGK